MSLLNFLYLRKGYGVRKAYTLAELGNAYDLGLASSFKTAFEKLGGTVIANNFPSTGRISLPISTMYRRCGSLYRLYQGCGHRNRRLYLCEGTGRGIKQTGFFRKVGCCIWHPTLRYLPKTENLSLAFGAFGAVGGGRRAARRKAKNEKYGQSSRCKFGYHILFHLSSGTF